MKIIRISSPISVEEREAHFFYDDDSVICDTTIPTVWRKCLKNGWVAESETYYEDNLVGMILRAPKYALSIRSAEKRKSNMSEEQRVAAAERLRKAREQKVGVE